MALSSENLARTFQNIAFLWCRWSLEMSIYWDFETLTTNKFATSVELVLFLVEHTNVSILKSLSFGLNSQ